MVPKTKNPKHIVTRPLATAPVTLRDVLDLEPDLRRQSALRRLETVLGLPLESMPAAVGWFDNQFPGDRPTYTCSFWTSVQAYRRWRSAARRAIRRQTIAVAIPGAHARPLQKRNCFLKKEHCDTTPSADRLLRHAEINSAIARYANFLTAGSDPKSN